jgi:hypothetical protein
MTADVRLDLERMGSKGIRAENAFLVRVAAKYEVNQLDKARLASTVPGLTIGCFGPLFGKDDIETLPER